jgi:hypothetical protein
MTIQVEISPEAEAILAADAVMRGMALEKYAGKLLEDAATPYATGTGILKPGDVAAMTKELTKGSEKMPILTLEANERSSYYEDRW